MKTFFISLCLVIGGGLVYAGQTNTVSLDKPMRLYAASDTQVLNSYSDNNTTGGEVDGDNDGDEASGDDQTWLHYDQQWQDGVGGHGSSSNLELTVDWDGTLETNSTSAARSWDTNNVGMEIDTANDGTLSTNNSIGLPIIASEHCVVNITNKPPATVYYTDDDDIATNKLNETYTRTAQTKWRLETGGKAIPQRLNLWHFSVSSSEITNKMATPYYTGAPSVGIGLSAPVVNGWQMKNDGSYWQTLPDGTNIDVTPYVAGKDFYIFIVNAQKYTLSLTASTNGTAVDISTNTPEFCVGQQVTFAATWDSDPGALSMTGFWHLPTKYVNEVYQAFGLFSPATTVYDINSSLLENTNQTTCWFVNGSGGACSVRETLHFANDQDVNIAAAGSFTVYRPTFTNFNNVFNFFTWDNPTLQGNMEWNVTLDSKYDGLFGVTQLINANGGIYDNGGFDCLDGNTEIYGEASGPNGPKEYFATNSTPGAHTTVFLDNPEAQVIYPPCPDMLADFKDYLRFKPGLSTNDGNIYVTIATNGWHMDGQACVTGVDHTNLPPASATVNNDTFPMWYGVRSGGGN